MQSLRFQTAATGDPNEGELVRLAAAGDTEAVRAIMTANNQRLYRMARAISGNSSEAEDIVQEAYVRAFTNLEGFRGDSALSTWLTRIVINEALGRKRKRGATPVHVSLKEDGVEAQILRFPTAMSEDPERMMAQRQIIQLVEQAADKLPAPYRLVLTARIIEGLSIEETCELLGLRPETVKTRLHRARSLLRKELDAQIGPVLMNAFPFMGSRCARLTEAVIERLHLSR